MTLQLTYRGFNYVDYYNGEYHDNDTLSEVEQTGANSVAMTPDWGIDVADSTIYAGGATTDSLANLTTAIQSANANGLTSFVRPLIDFLYTQKSPTDPNGYYVPGYQTNPDNVPPGVTPATVPPGDNDTDSYRGFLNPADLDLAKFFGSPTTADSYDKMIVDEAKQAQAAGAQLFSVGTELDSLANDTDPAVEGYWNTLIADVRAVFHGKLTYSANWSTADQVTFWDKLDYVGIDGYVPLSNVIPASPAQNPSLSSLIAGWNTVSNVQIAYSGGTTVGQQLGGKSAIDFFDQLAQSSISKKFIFTELGYQNDSGAATDPTGGSNQGVTDPTLQAELYQAFFDAWGQAQASASVNGGNVDGIPYSLDGVFFWNWNPDTSTAGYDDWSPKGYPALNTIETGFQTSGTSFALTTAANNFTGGAGNDVFSGPGGGVDTLSGGDGDDEFDVDSNQTGSIDGGTGTDTVHLVSAGGAFNNALGAGLTTSNVEVFIDDVQNVSATVAQLAAFSTIETNTAQSSFTILLSGAGGTLDLSTRYVSAPSLSVQASTTSAVTITGTSLADQIIGSKFNDVLDGGGGADTMTGGAGNDVYFVDNAGDKVFEAAGGGADRVETSVSCALSAGQSVEALETTNAAGTAAIDLTGNDLVNVLTGNAGGNVLKGGKGADVMVGGGGNDVYLVDNASDVVKEGTRGGIDKVLAIVGYALGSRQAIETLATTSTAGTTPINLTGNEVANTIFGNAGNNVIDGGLGNDKLYGYGGHDTFVFDTAPTTKTNDDYIADFTVGQDMIDLSHAIYAALPTGALASSAFTTGSAATTADQHLIYHPGNGALLYDADGSGAGAAVQFARLSTAPALNASQFKIIA